jgi:hypothetical protein
MKNVYCTLFDSYYLSRGVVMLRSLSEKGNSKDKIYVFCFDQHTLEVISQLQIPKVFPISLNEFETFELLKLKESRTKGEYCWTCTAHTILHVIKIKGEDECTYVDADLYFYQNPGIAVPTLESVLITEHRYTPKYDQTVTSGRFCVQFVTFKNEEKAMALLENWAKQCRDWCFNRVEDGKFGDQKYLDSWPYKESWIKISDLPGVGMAPWNIQQSKPNRVDRIFYHFHAITWYENDLIFLGGYDLHEWVKTSFYLPYLSEWTKTSIELQKRFKTPLPRVKIPQNRLKFWLKRWIFSSRFINV